MIKYFCDHCEGELKDTKYVIMVNALNGAIDIKTDEKNICTINTTGKHFCCPECLVVYFAWQILGGDATIEIKRSNNFNTVTVKS